MKPEQCRAARGWLGWSQEDLAKAAHVSLSTVRDYEKTRRVPIENNLAAIRLALENFGIEFLFEADMAHGIAYSRPKMN